MLNLRLVVFIMCSMAFSLTAAVEISLTGTVKDGSGAAIAGATVNLISDVSLNDTTNANGEFTLSKNLLLSRGTASRILVQNTNILSIKYNQLQFYTAVPAKNGAISIYSGNGKKSVEIPLGTMESGIHTHSLPQLTTGFYIMHIKIDELTTTWKLVRTDNETFISNNIYNANGTALLSTNAAAENVDTLIARKDGFATVKTAIPSYKQSDIAIVMAVEPVYAYSAAVENTCADCVVPELPDGSTLTVKNAKLPDPFKKLNGTRITKKSEWRCRRQEILKQAMKYIYGDKPAPPEVVTGTVTNTKISIHVEDKGKKIDFSATIKLPTTGHAPYPAIINMIDSSKWMTMLNIGEKRVLDQGVAVISFDYSKVGKEGPDGQIDRKKDFQGGFYNIYGGKHSAGLLMAWAWGASRMIDVLQKSDGSIIDYRRLGVTGCSRTAKAAFAVGLFDERIAVILSEETSVVGVPAYRVADKLCPENTQNNFTGQTWLSNDFAPFVKPNTEFLPIDANELVATIAPRGLYSMENPAATQMCAQGGHMSILGGMEVYKALGAEKNLSYNSNTPANTGHCSYTDNFTEMLNKNITKFLLHQSSETGGIVAGSGTLNKSDWIDWTAPTLENDTKIYETQ